MQLKEYSLKDEIKVDTKSLVVAKLLGWKDEGLSEWQEYECEVGGFVRFQSGSRELFSDGKFMIARGVYRGKEINYVEAIPWKEPSAKDAIQRLSVLQHKLVEKSDWEEVDFVVNLWGVVGGLQVSWQLQDVVALIREEKFKQEWIVIQERKFALFSNQKNWEIGEFPVSVLELFAKKKFPGKFKIVDKFEEVIEDLG